jgi:Concanavalin A-like lectin/glucanases superfamily
MANPVRAALPDEPTRDELEELIVQRATNDASVWRLLTNPATVRDGLAAVFGAAPPAGVNVRVRVEDENTFCHVVPAPEETVTTAGPPTLAPRRSFQRRVNYLLHTDPDFAARFKSNPSGAISQAFQFRFPAHVSVQPLVESARTDAAGATSYDLWVVLPYAAHDALLDSPYSIAFNGTDSAVWVPYSASLDIRTAISVEAWFKASSFRAGNWQDAVVSMHGPASGWELRVGGAVPRFVITIGGVHYYAQPDNPTPFLKTGTWYYLVGSYDGQQLTLHLNGKLLYTRQVSGSMNTFNGPLALGRNSYAQWSDRAFAGEVDEVRIRSRVLSTSEIRSYRPKKANGPVPSAADADLRASYPMSEGNGSTLIDHSQYGNNGTLANALWRTIDGSAP